MTGTDQQAFRSYCFAKSRKFDQSGLVLMSSTITGVFENAAVPQEPTAGPMRRFKSVSRYVSGRLGLTLVCRQVPSALTRWTEPKAPVISSSTPSSTFSRTCSRGWPRAIICKTSASRLTMISLCLRWVMSVITPMKCSGSPSSLLIKETLRLAQTTLPSRCT